MGINVRNNNATDLSLRAIKCCFVVFGITLKLLVTNISPSFPAINKHRRLLPAKCHYLRNVVRRRLICVNSSEARYWLWSRDFCLLYLHSTPPLGGFRSEYCHAVWFEKLEWLGYPMVKKVLRYLYSFWQNVRTWQTDEQADGHRMTAKAARQKRLW